MDNALTIPPAFERQVVHEDVDVFLIDVRDVYEAELSPDTIAQINEISAQIEIGHSWYVFFATAMQGVNFHIAGLEATRASINVSQPLNAPNEIPSFFNDALVRLGVQASGSIRVMPIVPHVYTPAHVTKYMPPESETSDNGAIAATLDRMKCDLRSWLNCNDTVLAAGLRMSRKTLHDMTKGRRNTYATTRARLFDVHAMIAGFLAVGDREEHLAILRSEGRNLLCNEGPSALEAWIEKAVPRMPIPSTDTLPIDDGSTPARTPLAKTLPAGINRTGSF